MPKIYSYQKVTDKYTTYTAVDNGEENNKITELCTIGDKTYISIPDDLVLPEQPKQITLKSIILTTELKEQIEEKSLHIQLIKKRAREKIRKKYSVEDEIKIIRNKINGKELSKYTEYNNYVKNCIAEGNLKTKKII